MEDSTEFVGAGQYWDVGMDDVMDDDDAKLDVIEAVTTESVSLSFSL